MTRSHTAPWAYENAALRADPSEVTLKIQIVPPETAPTLQCSEPVSRNGKFAKVGARCCARPRLVIDGHPVCDGHVARMLRRIATPVPDELGGGI